jgi:hypothetical protein
MLSSGVIDLAIGIIFVFGVTAAIASVATEAIARFLGLRGAYLLLGLRELLDGKSKVVDLSTAAADFGKVRTLMGKVPPLPPDAVVKRSPAPDPENPTPVMDDAEPGTSDPKSVTSALLGSPILRNQGMPGVVTTRPLEVANAGSNANKPASLPTSTKGGILNTLKLRRSLPSYIPARSFAEAVIDMVVPDSVGPDGRTTMNTVLYNISQLPDSMRTLRTSLEALAANANNDITQFRSSVEHWYDDHMARVSGWYKRHVAIITLVAGGILVLLLNINTITIGRALYSDSTIRSAVSAVAAKGVSCPQDQPSCLGNLEDQLTAAAQAGLPIGWGTAADCSAPNAKCNWWEQRGIISRHGNPVWEVILVLLGFLITIAAIAPGAQFWFGLLVKVNALRASGTPPAASAS